MFTVPKVIAAYLEKLLGISRPIFLPFCTWGGGGKTLLIHTKKVEVELGILSISKAIQYGGGCLWKGGVEAPLPRNGGKLPGPICAQHPSCPCKFFQTILQGK